MWERVVAQERAVASLQRAATQPSHAYLLTGPTGSGIDEAARCFAASLLCPDGGCGVCGVCERVLRGRHPDLVEVEPEGIQLRVEQATDVIETAFRTPLEAARKVIVMREADRMNEQAQNKLLKTFEEPPERTVCVLLTSSPDELLDTVRSRCQQVPFTALTTTAVRDALVADGLGADEAEQVARLAGGRLDRARLLTGEYRELHRAFTDAPRRLDGTGGAAAVVAGELNDAVESAFSAVKERHQREIEELDAEVEQAGYPEQVGRRLRKALTQRHRRLEQRARQDGLADGLTALESVYRDALVDADRALDSTRAPLSVSVESCLGALDAIGQARRRVQEGIILNWGLLLEDVLLHLPAPAPTSPAQPGSG